MKGIMIVGHGSRFNYNKWVMERQKERLEDMGFENIYIGFNETSIPLAGDTLNIMAAEGIDEVIAVPFFIASGLHITRDIPAKLRIPQNSDGGVVDINGKSVTIHYKQPFGNDPLLSTILSERAKELRDESKKGGILVIGHGSRLPYNKETIQFQSKRLEDMGFQNVRYAFNEFDEPKIESVMEEMVESGLEEIIVLPLFISMGAHLKNDVPGKIGLEDKIFKGTFTHNEKTAAVKYALPIGEDPRLTEVIAGKIREHM